jgi:predicted transcriptional regulator
MLEHLFGSKTRTKLLTLFLHNPEKAFFVRELTRLIDTQINAVRRELENLVELGLVNETEIAEEGAKRPGLKRKYYKMNEVFPLLAEIRTLVTKAHVLMERRLDREITQLGDIQYFALLGAFIGRTGAPVDLFIVGTIDDGATKKLIARLEKEMGFEINFTCMTPQEFKYRKEITDRFLYSILEAPKNVMVNSLDRLDELAS